MNGGDVDASAARAAHYAATRGAQGITLPGDMKVVATPTPSQGVRIGTGSCTVLNAQATGESYQGLARSSTDVGIDVTGATRYDLVVAQIIDPDFAPWTTADVPDTVNGPYFLPHVIKGVASGTTKASDVVSYAALALARIAVPASGNITNGLITDLRRLAQPRTWPHKNVQPGPSSGTTQLPTSQTAFTAWPGITDQVQVPDWATRAQIGITLNISVMDPVNIDLEVDFGGIVGPITYFDYNGTSGVNGAETVPITVFADLDVRSLAGETVPLNTLARRTFTDVATGVANFGSSEQGTFDVLFSETIV